MRRASRRAALSALQLPNVLPSPTQIRGPRCSWLNVGARIGAVVGVRGQRVPGR